MSIPVLPDDPRRQQFSQPPVLWERPPRYEFLVALDAEREKREAAARRRKRKAKKPPA